MRVEIGRTGVEQAEEYRNVGRTLTKTQIVNKYQYKNIEFQMMCGVHRTLSKKTRKETRLQFYKTMAVPVPVSYTHLLGSKIRSLVKRKIDN